MKITTHIRKRGAFPKLEIPQGGRAIDTYTADEFGVYTVPDDVGMKLLTTGNFTDIEAVADVPPALVKANVIVSDDGAAIDLDGMTRAELIEFAGVEFLLEFKQGDNKPAIVAAILAAAQPEESE